VVIRHPDHEREQGQVVLFICCSEYKLFPVGKPVPFSWGYSWHWQREEEMERTHMKRRMRDHRVRSILDGTKQDSN